jgi:hypothetical protein
MSSRLHRKVGLVLSFATITLLVLDMAGTLGAQPMICQEECDARYGNDTCVWACYNDQDCADSPGSCGEPCASWCLNNWNTCSQHAVTCSNSYTCSHTVHTYVCNPDTCYAWTDMSCW